MGGAGGGYLTGGQTGGGHCCTAYGGQGFNNGMVGGDGNCCYGSGNKGGFGGGGGGQLSGPVLVEVGLEVALQVNGLLDQLVEVVEVLTMLEPMHRIRQVVIQVILPIHTQEMDILR